MNELFKLNGLLKGEPGEYEVTEAGEPYATERDEHRGTGGYSSYNRDWTVRTWDDSVLDVMDTSPEMIREARENVSERRRLRHMAVQEGQSDDEFLNEEDEEFENPAASACIDPVDVVKGVAIVGAIVGTIVGSIIAVPHVKRFYAEKVKPTCESVWRKVTKKPYETLEATEVTDDSTVEILEQLSDSDEESKEE